MERVISDLGLVIAAAGHSRRFHHKDNKLLQHLRGLPVVCHCLRRLSGSVPPEQIVLIVPAQDVQQFQVILAQYGLLDAGLAICPGGQNRSESVYRGLQALPSSADLVAVQDAARPFSSSDLLHKCVASAKERGSGVAATRVTDTIKVTTPSDQVTTTLNRSTLAATETPQVFYRTVLLEAYEYVLKQGLSVTDDAQAVEILGHDVFLVFHDENNPKITYGRDLKRWEEDGKTA